MQPEERIITGQEQDADVWQYSLRPRRRAESGKTEYGSIHQGCCRQERSARSCAFIWAAWSGENHISKYYCQ